MDIHIVLRIVQLQLDEIIFSGEITSDSQQKVRIQTQLITFLLKEYLTPHGDHEIIIIMVLLFVDHNLHGIGIHDQLRGKIYGDEEVQMLQMELITQIQISNDHVLMDIMFHILQNG